MRYHDGLTLRSRLSRAGPSGSRYTVTMSAERIV